MAKVIYEIHSSTQNIKSEKILLKKLYPIHPLNRENSLEATRHRAKILNKNKDKILEK